MKLLATSAILPLLAYANESPSCYAPGQGPPYQGECDTYDCSLPWKWMANSQPAGGMCDDVWFYLENDNYFTYSEAQAYCQNLAPGGNIASVLSEQESTFLLNTYQMDLTYAWIGLEWSQGGEYDWADGACRNSYLGPEGSFSTPFQDGSGDVNTAVLGGHTFTWAFANPSEYKLVLCEVRCSTVATPSLAENCPEIQYPCY